MNKLIIYTNEQCPYCKTIKEELDKHQIKYTNRLTKDHKEEWQNIIDLTGLPTVPTIQVGEEYLVPSRDFASPQHLASVIKNYKKSGFSYQRQIFEKVKTLNHSINMAFGRLDHLLRQIEAKLNTEEKDGNKSTS